jgi:tRNA nucleotidyltransferase/poly(A) polymerase
MKKNTKGTSNEIQMKFKTFLKEQVDSKKGKEFLDYALPMNVRNVIKKRGGKIYQIGGAVRDAMVNKVSKDLDIIVTGFELKDLENLLKQFGKADMVGKKFGIIKFTPRHFVKGDEPIDVSVPRIDKKSTGAKHTEVEVELGKHISLKQDQLRRDFWMNTMAQDIETEEIIDVDGQGMLDIKNKVIRMIKPDAFEEDALRMLRAVQFASRFDFKIEAETLKEIQKVAHTITSISGNRFVEEFKKLYLKSDKPSIGVKYLIETGIYKAMFGDVKYSDRLFSGVDKLDKNDFNGFMTILLMPTQDPKKALQRIAPSNELELAVTSGSAFIKEYPKNVSDADLVIAVGRMRGKPTEIIENIDSVTKAMGTPYGIAKRLNDLRKQGIPTNLSELSVKGNEVSGPKHEISKKLEEILRYAVTNKTNDKETLLKV